MGFALMGVINGSIEGVTSLCLYLLIYLAMSLAIFISIIALKNGDEHIEDINQLSGLSKTKPINAIVISILLFSLAGIPPLAGFFAKFYFKHKNILPYLLRLIFFFASFDRKALICNCFLKAMPICEKLSFEENEVSFIF